jgi:GGDEF domain-containing protein
MTDTSAPGRRVFDEQDFRRLLAWEVQRATRYQDFLSLCLVRPEHRAMPGRAILEALARRIAEFLRATDVVSLHDDDSIAIMLVHTADSDARAIAARIRSLLEGLTLRPGPDGPAGTPLPALGLASFPTDATSDGALLQTAQTRLADARAARGPHPIV